MFIFSRSYFWALVLFISMTPFSAFSNEKQTTSRGQTRANKLEKTMQNSQPKKDTTTFTAIDQVLKKGKSYEHIRELQEQLTNEGYYTGPIDGIMTKETRRAAKYWTMGRD